MVSKGESFDLIYNVQVRDQNGNPIPNIEVSYNQENEKSIIYIYDPNKNYTSALYIGTPRELEQLFGGYNLLNSQSSSTSLKKPFVIILTLGILVTLYALTSSQLDVAFNAYKIQQFYLTDYVSSQKDYEVYCKTFEQIAELIKARTGVVTGITSIFITLVTSGASGGAHNAIELAGDVSSIGVDKIRDMLYNQAVEKWGVTMDSIKGKTVGVRVFPYHEKSSWANVKNLFAGFEIIKDEPLCQDSNLQEGLVAYYPFVGNANDESGNGNHGTVHGATLTTDRNGYSNKAYHFDGVNDYISMGTTNNLRPENITVGAWFKVDNFDFPNSSYWVIGNEKDFRGYAILMFFDGSNHKWGTRITDGSIHDAIGTTIIEKNTWYYVAMAFDGSNAKVYVNGNLESSISAGKRKASWPFYVGVHVAGGAYFNGIIDDIRVYNRALTNEEIDALYNE